MGMLGLAGAIDAGFVEKATMELKPSWPAQGAHTSLAKSVAKHTHGMLTIETSLQHGKGLQICKLFLYQFM